LTGFFSPNERKYIPIPKFKADREMATKKIFILDVIKSTSNFLIGMCEKKFKSSAIITVKKVIGKNFTSNNFLIEIGADFIFQNASASILTIGYKNLNEIDEIKNKLKVKTIR
jgi:pantothenate kinase type III